MLHTIILLLSVITIYGCSPYLQIGPKIFPRTLTIRGYKKCHVHRFNVEKLESIYKSYDINQLEDFLRMWSSCSQKKVIIDNETVPEFLLDAYEIFQDFYNPYNLVRLADLEKVQKIYQDAQYFIIQENLVITKRATLKKDDFGRYTVPADYIFTIDNFYPYIELSEKIPLYLSAYSREYLLQFLGDESYPLGHGNIMNPARAKGDSRRRQRFLNQFVRILHGHWGGWHLESHPYVFSINFNNDYSQAMVDFRIVYQGGEAIYKKKRGEWKLITSELTWIE